MTEFIQLKNIQNQVDLNLDLIINISEITAVAKLKAFPEHWRVYTKSFGEFFIENVDANNLIKILNIKTISATSTDKLLEEAKEVDKALKKYGL